MTIRPTRRVTAAALTVTALAAGLLATAAPASAATGGLTNSCTGTLTATVTGADPLTEYRVYVDFTAGPSLAASDVSDAGGAISPMTVNVPSNLDVDVYLTSTPDGEMARVALACAVPASVTGMSATVTVGTITDSSSPATTTSQYTNMLATYTWTAPPATRMPLTGYLVSYMDHNGALAGPGNGGTPLAAGATSFTSTRADRAAAGLSPLQPFSVRVSAVNANGSGAPSQPRVAIMPGANPAGTPWLDTVHVPPTLHTLATSELDISGEFALLDDPAWLTPLTGVELFYIHEGDAGTADVAQSGTPLMSTADAVSLGVFPAAGNSANVPFSATLPAAGSYRLYWQGIAGAARSTIFPSSRNTPPQVTVAVGAPAAPAPAEPAPPAVSPPLAPVDPPTTQMPPLAPTTPALPAITDYVSGIPVVDLDDLAHLTRVGETATGFKKGKAVLRPKAKKDVGAFAQSLTARNPRDLLIAVYGFSGGTGKGKQVASERRAVATAKYLRSLGYDARIVVGLGTTSASGVFGHPLGHNRMAVLQGYIPTS